MSASNDNEKQKSKLTLQDYVQKFNELSTVFDSMPTGVFAILDQKSNIATINKTASGILDADSQSIIGKKAQEILEKKFPGVQKLINETIKKRCPIKNFTLEIENRNAEVKTYLVSTALTDELEDTDFGVVLVLNDISEVTRLRKAAMALQSFGR